MLFPKDKFFLIAGPCVIENRDMLLKTAETLKEICTALGVPLIFKASFDKANRTAIDSFRGPGMEAGLKLLKEVKDTFSLAVTTDVHTPQMIAEVAQVVDLIQVPAFLARQTDFLTEAGRIKIPLNIKKGQYMAPAEMKQAVKKYYKSGGTQAAVTERGTFFGYGNLVVDFRSLPVIKAEDITYIFDATHSVQLPAAAGSSSGGQREFIPVLAKAQVAAGCDGIFMETHPEVEAAKCDRETQWPLKELKLLVAQLKDLYYFCRK